MTDREPECVICTAGTPTDVIADGPLSWVTAPDRAALPGYVCVVCKAHAVEPFDLPQADQATFWLEVCLVARAVREAVGSHKINYEIHGNTIPHLHLHIFPRYPGDPFSGGPIDGASRGFRRTSAELQVLAAVIQSDLDQLAGQLSGTRRGIA